MEEERVMNEKEKQALENLSAAVFGNLCEYIRLFGSPHQIRHIKEMLNSVLSDQTQTTTRDVAYWKKLRQSAYELAGDWLWMHATNHYRVKIAPLMKIPNDNELLDTLLSVDAIEDGYGLNHGTTTIPGKKRLSVCNNNESNKKSRSYDEDEEAGSKDVTTWNLSNYKIEGLEDYFEPNPEDTDVTKENQEEASVDKEKATYSPDSADASDYLGVEEKDGLYSAALKEISLGEYSTKREAAVAIDFCAMLLSIAGIKNIDHSMKIATVEQYGDNLKTKYADIMKEITNKLDENNLSVDQMDSDIDLSALRDFIQTEVGIWSNSNPGTSAKPTETSPEMKIDILLDALLSPDSVEERKSIVKMIQTSDYNWMSSLYYLLFLHPISSSEYNKLSDTKLLNKLCVISCRVLNSILKFHEYSLTWGEYNPVEQKAIIALIAICKLSDTDNIEPSSTSSSPLLYSVYIVITLLKEVTSSDLIAKYALLKIPLLQTNRDYINTEMEQLQTQPEAIVPIAKTWIKKFLKARDDGSLDHKECLVLDLEDHKSVIGELDFIQFLELIGTN